jgi:hypothetical protein
VGEVAGMTKKVEYPFSDFSTSFRKSRFFFPSTESSNTSQDIRYTTPMLIKLPFYCLVAGIAAGLFGIGSGMIINPVLLNMNVPPRVCLPSLSLLFSHIHPSSFLLSTLPSSLLLPSYYSSRSLFALFPLLPPSPQANVALGLLGRLVIYDFVHGFLHHDSIFGAGDVRLLVCSVFCNLRFLWRPQRAIWCLCYPQSMFWVPKRVEI